jgi:hypothetical protein
MIDKNIQLAPSAKILGGKAFHIPMKHFLALFFIRLVNSFDTI